MSERKNTCGTCAAFHEYETSQLKYDGDCHLLSISKDGWPGTYKTWWCLEWVNPKSIDLQHNGLPIEALRQIVADYDDREDAELDGASKPN